MRNWSSDLRWFLLAAAVTLQLPSIAAVKPLRSTDALPLDPDDPAIWVNRTDPSKSLVLGTMKVAAPDGALAVFGIDGKLRQLLQGPIARTTSMSSTASCSTTRRRTSPC